MSLEHLEVTKRGSEKKNLWGSMSKVFRTNLKDLSMAKDGII